MRSQLKKIEDLGAAMEEALILDNKYTEHSTVGLAQQWDQLDQLGMRMQHNLEQQIQARCLPPAARGHGRQHGKEGPCSPQLLAVGHRTGMEQNVLPAVWG